MISVLMSIYNEKLVWVQESLNSVLNQRECDMEVVIIIDNPQVSEEIISYLMCSQMSHSNIHVYQNEDNIGLANSMNRGLQYANGEYIARMDADDIALPDRLHKELKFLKENDFDMVSCYGVLIDEEGHKMGDLRHSAKNPNRELLVYNFIIHSGVLMKTEVLRALGGYRNFSKAQDYDLWLRMISENFRIGILGECLLKYRLHGDSITGKNMLEQFYISEYQRKLYRERKKTGQDSFSEEHLNQYIRGKRITPQKNHQYTVSRNYMDQAIRDVRDKKFRFLIYLFQSAVLYPFVPIWSIKAFIKTSIYRTIA